MGLFRALRDANIKGADAARGIKRALRPVTSHGDVLVDDADAAQSIGRIDRPTVFIAVGTARISETGPKGESSFLDARYWIQWTAPLATTGNNAKEVWAMAIGPKATTSQAINLCELAIGVTNAKTASANGCHLLSVGEPVTVFANPDNQGIDRYFFAVNPSPVRVRITNSTSCGKGIYHGTSIKRPTADIDPTADLASDAAGPAVIIRNLQEYGRVSASAWLTNAGNTLQKDFIGVLSYVNSDGTAVIDISGAWFKAC